MMSGVKEEATTYFFRIPIQQEVAADAVGGLEPGVADAPVESQGDAEGAAARVAAAVPLESDTEGARLTYRSSGNGGASSYSVDAAGGTTTDDQGRVLERRDDGSTVRRVAAGATYTADDKVGRNDPCPCGSGQKFKRCHGA